MISRDFHYDYQALGGSKPDFKTLFNVGMRWLNPDADADTSNLTKTLLNHQTHHFTFTACLENHFKNIFGHNARQDYKARLLQGETARQDCKARMQSKNVRQDLKCKTNPKVNKNHLRMIEH